MNAFHFCRMIFEPHKTNQHPAKSNNDDCQPVQKEKHKQHVQQNKYFERGIIGENSHQGEQRRIKYKGDIDGRDIPC